MFTEWLGYLAATLTTAAFLPQVLHTWRRRSARDLSVLWLVTFSVGVLGWLAYGVLTRSRPVVVGNAVTLGLTGTLAWLKWRY
ncbi:MAG: SemiSWEET family sugar transporter [Vicinamibacterales bacterium]